jgi:hypothetical protein
MVGVQSCGLRYTNAEGKKAQTQRTNQSKGGKSRYQKKYFKMKMEKKNQNKKKKKTCPCAG